MLCPCASGRSSLLRHMTAAAAAATPATARPAGAAAAAAASGAPSAWMRMPRRLLLRCVGVLRGRASVAAVLGGWVATGERRDMPMRRTMTLIKARLMASELHRLGWGMLGEPYATICQPAACCAPAAALLRCLHFLAH